MSDMTRTSPPDRDSRIDILVVDDERDFANGLVRLLTGRFGDLRVAAASSGREALERLTAKTVRVMITDLRMPEMNGLQLMAEALRIKPDLSMVVLSAYGTIETAVEAPGTPPGK